MEAFEKFFRGFEEEFQKRRLWLDKEVREHLVFMQMYFSFFNIIPVMVKRMPLPKGKELTDEEFSELSDELLFLMGVVCDAEINSLLSELDELIVSSVYKLDLKRPSKSVLRNRMVNLDTKKLNKRLSEEMIPGVHHENIYDLIISMVYAKKGINPDEMSNEEYDEFVKSADPKAYEEIQEEFDEFKSFIKTMVEQEGLKIVPRSELENHPGEYAVSLKDILTQNNPEITTTDEFVKPKKMKTKSRKSKKK